MEGASIVMSPVVNQSYSFHPDTNNGTDILVHYNEALDWKPYDRAAAIISFTLFVLIVGLNIAVIYVLQRIRGPKKNRLYFFIFHLAIADILVGLINVLPDGIQSAMNGNYVGGDIFCRMWRFSKLAVVLASNNLLIGMSIDRFLAVKSPMIFVRNGNILSRALVVGAWIISLGLPVVVLPYSKGVTGIDGCQLHLPSYLWKPYLLTIAAVVYILPTVFISLCYTGICIVVWRKWKNGLALSEINRDKSLDQLHVSTYRRKSSGILPRAKVKSIKMTLIVCLAFFLCWTPYFIFSLLDVYGANIIEQRLYMVLGMLYPLNSACNPIVFILFNLRLFHRQKYSDGIGVTQLTNTTA